MTTIETAQALGVTERQVRQLIAAKRLKAVKRGRDWDVSPASVKARPSRRYQRKNGKK